MFFYNKLLSYRYFLGALVKKDFTTRYTQSVLGMIWIILDPLFTVLTFSLVFVLAGRKGLYGAPFPVYFYSGLVIWNFINGCLSKGVKSYLNERGLWSKLDFPRELIALKEVAIHFFDMLLSLIPVLPIFLFFGYFPNVYYLLLIPIVILTMMFGLGLVFLFGSFNVYIRDIGIIIGTISKLWFWTTPLIFDYPFSGLTKVLYYINPMAGVVYSFRRIILIGVYPEWETLISITIAAPLTLMLGYHVFKKLQRGFADVV